jgi:hypothetical protein
MVRGSHAVVQQRSSHLLTGVFHPMLFLRESSYFETNSARPIFASGYTFPTQLDQGATEGLQKQAIELQTVESHFLQRGWPSRGQYGGSAPQDMYRSRRLGRPSADGRCGSHFMSIIGGFIVVFHQTVHQTAGPDRTPSFLVIRPTAARARYVRRTTNPRCHMLIMR